MHFLPILALLGEAMGKRPVSLHQIRLASEGHLGQWGLQSTVHSHQFSTCLLSRVHAGGPSVGHQSHDDAFSDMGTLSRRPTEMSLGRPSEETSLSTLSFACHCVVYDAECFCNSLYFEDFLLGCY